MSPALADPETEAPADASWRDPDIETLRLPRKIEDRFRANKIESVGALVDALDNGDTFELDAREIAHTWHLIQTNSECPDVLIDGDDEPEDPDGTVLVDPSEAPPTPEEAVEESEPQPAGEGAEPPVSPPVATAAAPDPEDEANLKARLALIRERREQELTEYDRESVQLVADEEAHVSKLEDEYESLKEAASEAKKEFEKAEQRLRKLIRDRQSERGQPSVFDKKFTDSDDATSHPEIPDNSTGQPSGDYGELWQRYPMDLPHWERFGLKKGDIEKLNSGETKSFGVCPILLFGDVSRFITPNASNPSFTRALKDFKGFGDKGAQRYADAELEFWKWWNANGAAEFAAEQGVKPNADSQEPTAGAGSEDPQPIVEAADGQPVESPAAEPAQADDSRPLSDAAEEQHPDVAPPKKKRGRPKKQPASV